MPPLPPRFRRPCLSFVIQLSFSKPSKNFKSHLSRGDVAATLAKVASTSPRLKCDPNCCVSPRRGDVAMATSWRRHYSDIAATSFGDLEISKVAMATSWRCRHGDVAKVTFRNNSKSRHGDVAATSQCDIPATLPR